MHLAEHGHPGRRYFLVNRDPARMHEFAATFARLVNRAMRVWRVPVAAARLMVGPVVADDMRTDQIFSNIRLRNTELSCDTRWRDSTGRVTTRLSRVTGSASPYK